MVLAAIAPWPCLITGIFAPEASISSGASVAASGRPPSLSLYRAGCGKTTISPAESLKGARAIDGDAEFAFLNHMDASGPALEFDVEAGPKFGRQHPLSVELNEPQNVGKQIGVRLKIGRWSKNSVVGVMGFHGESSICSSSEFDSKAVAYLNLDRGIQIPRPFRQAQKAPERTAICRNACHHRTRVGHLIRNDQCEIFYSQPLPPSWPERHLPHRPIR